jgi:hypothetical protein
MNYTDILLVDYAAAKARHLNQISNEKQNPHNHNMF